eukprot:221803-Rhodomonas_salina.1
MTVGLGVKYVKEVEADLVDLTYVTVLSPPLGVGSCPTYCTLSSTSPGAVAAGTVTVRKTLSYPFWYPVTSHSSPQTVPSKVTSTSPALVTWGKLVIVSVVDLPSAAVVCPPVVALTGTAATILAGLNSSKRKSCVGLPLECAIEAKMYPEKSKAGSRR